MNEKILKHDEEIELMDLLFVIWRWKVFIIVVVVLAIISASIYVFSVSDIYKCSMIIKPVLMEQNGLSKQRQIPIASLTDIKAVMGSKQLSNKIMDSLKLYKKDLYKGGLFFNARSAKKTDNIIVDYYSYEPDQGIAILNSLLASLNEYFQPKVNGFIEKKNLKISEIDIQIINYKNQLRRAVENQTAEVNYILKEMEYLENWKSDSEKAVLKIIERVTSIEKQKERIEKKYDVLIGQSKNSLNTKDFSILFFNTIFFLESKLDRIQKDKYNLQMLLLEKKNTKNENFVKSKELFQIKRKVQEDFLVNKEEIDLSINRLENAKSLIKSDIDKNKLSVEAIKPPESLSKPVKPKKELTILLSFISSLFISIFCVFGFEYFRKHSKRMGIDN